MKVSIVELRDIVADAVRRAVKIREAKKQKITAPESEEAVVARRERRLRALPGYEHGEVLDMSKPLGKKNLAKRQGATGMGNWTSESVGMERNEAIRMLVRMIVAEEIRVRRGR